MGGIQGFILSSLGGGAASKLTGGKFRNGAATAAFTWALSQGAQRLALAGRVDNTGFSTPDEAAESIIQSNMEVSDTDNRERGGLLYRDRDGKYHAVIGEPGPACSQGVGCYVDVDSALHLVPDSAVIVGDWHIHMKGVQPLFSPGDIDSYNNAQFSYDARGIPAEYKGGYLGSHDGNIYFYPAGELDTSNPLRLITDRDIRNASRITGRSYP